VTRSRWRSPPAPSPAEPAGERVGQVEDGVATVVLVALGLGGATIVGLTLLSAITTVVVPRGVPVRLTRVVFRSSRRLFELGNRSAGTYEDLDRLMALYAPLTLVALPVVWLTLVLVGFTAIFRALGIPSWTLALEASGSSMTTLGFVPVTGIPQYLAAFVEAAIGLLLLALLITYLPAMYGAFARREALVTSATVAAGQPPTGWVMLERFHALAGLDRLEQNVWVPWTAGFVDIEESHTSLSALPFFRSPRPERSWVTAAGAVLDAAALLQSCVVGYHSPPAQLCIRSGFLALGHIADFYGIAHDPEPGPEDPIAISRDEWDEVYDQLAAAGLPMVADRDRAWLAFRGWRVNYDEVLLRLAQLTWAPYAPWSSDRSPVLGAAGSSSGRVRPPILRRRR